MEYRTIVVALPIGLVGSFIANQFGGWSNDLATLIIFMAIDFITGLIVAGVFKKSKKSKKGALESSVGFKGLAKKIMILLFVLIGYRLDLLLGSNYVRTAVIIAFICSEAISITENAGLMGIPIPKPIREAIDILRGDNDDQRN